MKFKSMFFKNATLNIIIGALLIIASVIELLGYFWFAEIEYFTNILRYLIGGLLIVYGIYLMALYIRKSNSTLFNANVIGVSTIIMLHGIFNMVLKNNSMHYFALAIFLTGALLVIEASVKKLKIQYTYVGILVILIGFIAYLKLQMSYFIYSIMAILFAFGLLMMIAGLTSLKKKRK